MSRPPRSNRERALRLMRHPLNRSFFQNVVKLLNDDGVYGWPDMQEKFTRQEIIEQLKIAEKEDADKTQVS